MRIMVRSLHGQKFTRPHLNQWVIHTCQSSYVGRHIEEDLKQDPISKITNKKRAGRVSQVVEYLPSKCETLSSTHSSQGKKRKKEMIRCMKFASQ
jgi:hypothetical protein